MAKPTGRPLKFSPAEIQKKTDLFFQNCEVNDKPYTITGLAIALGFTSRQMLYEYEQHKGFGDIIKKARFRCEQYAEQRGFDAKNPAFSIFVLKNYGWTDRTDTTIDMSEQTISLLLGSVPPEIRDAVRAQLSARLAKGKK